MIIDSKHKGRGCKLHYLIKWKGYPASNNSWEPAENLNAEELIKEYEKRKQPNKTKARKAIKKRMTRC